MISRVWFSVGVLCLVGGVGSFAGCSTLRSAQKAVAPAAEFHACASRALEPIAGSYERAEQIVRDVQAHRTDMSEVLDAAQATVAEASKARAELEACAKALRDAVGPSGAGGSGGGSADAGAP